MRKYSLLCIIIIFGIFICANFVSAEIIDNFDVEIKINPDSSIEVTETILYNFENLERHGIYREIPIKYKARGGNYNLRISKIQIHDENNNKYNYKITYPGDLVNIRIGDADVYVTGKKTYIIEYKIKRALNYFDDYDELYWNATGNEWNVNINNATTRIFLPEKIDDAKIKCFIGAQGDTTECENDEIIYNENDEIIGVKYSQKHLESYNGLTTVLGIPKNIISQPSIIENLGFIIVDNWLLIIPIIVFLICYLYWRKYGKDPEGRGTVIAQFDPPDKLSPAEVGAIYDAKTQGVDVSSEIINLAVKGWIKITRLEKGNIFKKADYEFELLKKLNNKKLSDVEWYILIELFKTKKINAKTKLSDQDDKFYSTYYLIRSKLWNFLINNKYYPENYKSIKSTYFGIGIFVIIGSIASLSLFIMYLGYYLFAASILSGIIIIVFGQFMPKITKKGALTKEYIFGLKEYLTVAEKERLKFHNAPEKTPQEFERLLPYAMVLGVEEEWAKQFKNLYIDNSPSWYNDNSLSNFSAIALARGVSIFKTASASNLTSSPPPPPSSSSSGSASGSSGFSSGGGFSGGGFGGGGGGSW